MAKPQNAKKTPPAEAEGAVDTEQGDDMAKSKSSRVWRSPLPSVDDLKRLFRYDDDTGALYYRARPPSMFANNSNRPREASCASWNSAYAGKPIRYVRQGYLTAKIRTRNYQAHRIIWKMATGEEPDYLDHINGDRADNRLQNLRSCSAAENSRNLTVRQCNKSGHAGVLLRGGHWQVTYAARYIGSSTDLETAIAIRKAEELRQRHVTRPRKKSVA